jgi:hypothetical protein
VVFVDVDELIQKAWNAVERAGVPESIQGVALKEAIDFLRGDSGGERREPQKRNRATRGKPRAATPFSSNSDDGENIDPDEFFAQLADESGLDETALRDVLLLKGSVVHVIPPTRKLGTSKSQQAARVTALVAGAYVHGLGQHSVSAKAVHDEVKRKRCFDPNNYSGKVLGKLKGFSAGSDRSEIVVGSKWLGEFKEAVEAVSDAEASSEDE